ncbi:MAG: hypothetical protein ABJC26_15190 [Gemmatimonadaceae bacterium]
MYSTCLFCHSALGSNDVVEEFQVGRRLAFDAERGRLWVVCKKCHNWNLSPIEHRWEAVEACERIFRNTRIRVSTENIGLATLGEGLDLVRVGKPLLPEFAAWRYGSRIKQRRFRAAGITIATGAAAAIGMVTGTIVLAAGVAAVGAVVVPAAFMGAGWIDEKFTHERVLTRVRAEDGKTHSLKLRHFARLEVAMTKNEAGWKFRVAHESGMLELEGSEATRVAGQILAHINRAGGTPAQVHDAAQRITALGDAERYIRHTSEVREIRRYSRSIFWNDEVGVLGLTQTERLALEIAVHEDAERQLIRGELSALESAWRDAEEIAAISDSLFVKPDLLND